MRISAVARIPAASAPPTLTEVDGFVAPVDIELTETLNLPESIQFSIVPGKQASAVKTRFKDLLAQATEIWVWDEEVDSKVFAGPLLGYSPKMVGDEIMWDVRAAGLLEYLKRMRVEPDGGDITAAGVDQAFIAKALIDYWQLLSYGNYGIDTSGIVATTVLRDRTYLAIEAHLIAQRISELAAVNNGFDFHIDPETREFLVDYPMRGIDRTSTIVIDGLTIVDPSAQISAGPEDVCTDAYGVGDEGLVSHRFSAPLRAAIGRAGFAGAFSGVTVQATLDDHTQQMLDQRSTQLHIPARVLFPTSFDWADFGVGDLVEFAYDYGAGTMVEQRRVYSRTLTIPGEGARQMSVELM